MGARQRSPCSAFQQTTTLCVPPWPFHCIRCIFSSGSDKKLKIRISWLKCIFTPTWMYCYSVHFCFKFCSLLLRAALVFRTHLWNCRSGNNEGRSSSFNWCGIAFGVNYNIHSARSLNCIVRIVQNTVYPSHCPPLKPIKTADRRRNPFKLTN
jgi:hypothetical protein